jgi:hypothetical protein
VLQPFVAAAAAAAAAASLSVTDNTSLLLLGNSRPLLAFDAGLLRHAPPADSSHPERPERAAAVMGRLLATGLAARCKRVRGSITNNLTLLLHDTLFICPSLPLQC